jgi:broad specificity phosphatase PhoE
MTSIIVIRHGQTDWNEAGLIQGRTDRPLSAKGQEQIGRWRLPDGWTGSRCISSPLRRALDTAKLLGLDPRPEPLLTEMAWGDWEGKSLAALRQEFGTAMTENEARGLDFRPPGGESPCDVQMRLRPLLRAIQERTIVVTHKGVLRALYALATGWTMAEKPPQKLLEGRAHAFAVAADGTPTVAELNISLQPEQAR